MDPDIGSSRDRCASVRLGFKLLFSGAAHPNGQRLIHLSGYVAPCWKSRVLRTRGARSSWELGTGGSNERNAIKRRDARKERGEKGTDQYVFR